MTVFKVNKNSIEITEIEIVKKSDSCIWLKGRNGGEPRRELKSTNYSKHFDTWEHAKNHIVYREERKLHLAKEALTRAESDVRKAHELSLGAVEV